MKPTLVFDLEIFPDYFLAAFLNIDTGNVRHIEMHADAPLDVDTLRAILRKYRLISFNGINFDMPLLHYAIKVRDCAKVKVATDAIINTNLRGWQFEQKYGIEVDKRIDHIDLIEVAPGIASLKIYGGRLHCPKMQDLPIEPDASIAPEQRPILRQYCENDLHTTATLYQKLLPQIELRERMSAEYGVDLRSKSDAQIAEAIIRSGVEKLTGERPEKPLVMAGTVYRYRTPEFISFATPRLRETLAMIQRAEFRVNDSGKILEPVEFKDAVVPLGSSVYRLGIGGLHSSEKSVSYTADENTVLIDRDVTSYYPSIILRCGLMPKHMGTAFLRVYKDIVRRRLEAKRSGDKVTADALKIVINGSFGKFGSKWSTLYSPDLLIQTTITGQLALLMLIEQITTHAGDVVSANTDGVVIRCLRPNVDTLDNVVAAWEMITGFDTEATEYSALYSRDVNNYIAIKPDGSYKAKGAYTPAGLSKNPTAEVCVDAVVAMLRNGKPIEDSIGECSDLRKFVCVRSVKGGALDQRGNYLGKAVRWFYSKSIKGPLTYKINGYTVPRTEGAQAWMNWMETPGLVLDYDWYIAEARSILADIGAAHLLNEEVTT